MSRIYAILIGMVALGWSARVMAQEVPAFPSPSVPTVDVEQLFPPVEPVPPIEALPIPEVINLTAPQVPATEFPESNIQTTPLGTPGFNPIPFAAPQFNPPQFVSPTLAPAALNAPQFNAPAFNAFQSSPIQFISPAFAPPAFNPPNLAAPTLSAPSLTFLEAPPSEQLIQPVAIPQTVPVEIGNPFGN